MAIMHDRIKELRNKNGLTLAQIADKLDVTEATAQRYETGRGIKTVPYDVIEKYANIFNCTPQYIMGWEKATSSEIKNSNTIADITDKMFKDSTFMEAVELLNKLDQNQLERAKELLQLFFKE